MLLQEMMPVQEGLEYLIVLLDLQWIIVAAVVVVLEMTLEGILSPGLEVLQVLLGTLEVL